MLIDKDEIINHFRLEKSGQKGWFIAEEPCPYCGKGEGHLSLILEGFGGFICQKCKEKGSLYKILSEIGRLDLINYNNIKSLDRVEDKVSISKDKKEEEIDYKLPIIKPPLGFRRLERDEYLEGRGFTKEDFDYFQIGHTKLDHKLNKDYVIFMVFDPKGELVGYVGRSRKSKEEIARINEKRKAKALEKGEKKYFKYLRWVNSGGDFGKMIIGCDQIIPGVTKTILAVEGITDKQNIDKLLDLRNNPEIKCNGS